MGNAETPTLQIPMFTEELVIEGAPVRLQIAPLPDDKAWAFTARWDDNHSNSLNMHAAMARIGMRGTFYLNASHGEFGADFARKLSSEGSSIGGHTHTHGFLPTLNANRLFREILLNRIERESETDQPINSFAFPFGRFRDNSIPEAFGRITRAWLRSGYHHNVYMNFVRDNPHLPEHYASSGHQVVPGDRVINAPAFREKVDEILANPERNRAIAPVISVGVHPWQPPEQLQKFEALLSEYTGREDFWYCSQTDLAAYRFTAANSDITPVTGQAGRYAISRPLTSVAGAAIPLTLVLHGKAPRSVRLAGQILSIQATAQADQWLVNLPLPPAQAVPQTIDWQSFGPGFAAESPVREQAQKLPDLSVDFTLLPDKGWELVLDNRGTNPLQNMWVTLRLPELYQEGIRVAQIGTLPAGSSRRVQFEPGTLSTNPADADGALFAAAEINFIEEGKSARFYAVYQDEADPASVQGARDATVILGPLAPDGWRVEQLLPYSVPEAPLTALDDSVLGSWSRPDANQRNKYDRDLFIDIRPQAEWKKAASAFRNKPCVFVIVANIRLDEAAPLQIDSALPVRFAAVDGHAMPLTDNRTEAALAIGEHRVLLVLDSLSRHPFYRELPQALRLYANDRPVHWLAPAQIAD